MRLHLPHAEALTAHTIFGIGRNYAAHAKEMSSPVPKEPLVFLKPLSALTYCPDEIVLPRGVGRVDHEVEWVLVLGKGGRNLTGEQARASVTAMAVGLDLTARELQDQAKKNGTPWTLAKGLDGFGVVGPLVPCSSLSTPVQVELKINGETRQSGNTRDLIFSAEALISYLSQKFTLMPGTVIFTGTPHGIGPLQDGDEVDAILTGTESRIRAKVHHERGAR